MGHGKIFSALVLPLHGEVDISNSTNKTSSPSVSRLHGEVDICHGKTSSPSVLLLLGRWTSQIQPTRPLPLGVKTPWGGGHMSWEDLFSLGVATPWGGGHLKFEDLFSLGVSTPWGGGHLKW